MSLHKLQQQISEKQAILDSLLNDKEHPERFDRRIAEFDEKIRFLTEQRDHIVQLRDNLQGCIDVVTRQLADLREQAAAMTNVPLLQLEKLRQQYEALLAQLPPDRREDIKLLGLPEVL